MGITIGLTYDLRAAYLAEGYSMEETAEFDREDTIAALEETLLSLGHTPQRIGNGKQLAEALTAGSRWDLVFNIADGMHGVGRGAQVPALLDMYGIPYTFSTPLVMSLTGHKGMTKRILRDAGIPTADFLIATTPEGADSLRFGPPYFIKPVAEGTGKGISADSIIQNRTDLKDGCQKLMDRFHQPVLIERYLPGREFTTGILGTGPSAEILGTVEMQFPEPAEPGTYSFANRKDSRSKATYALVKPEEDPIVAEAEAVALAAYRTLGCRDAGRVDLRCNPFGHPLFMEIHPMAGLHPETSDLPILCKLSGISYRSLIEQIVNSAAERIK